MFELRLVVEGVVEGSIDPIQVGLKIMIDKYDRFEWVEIVSFYPPAQLLHIIQIKEANDGVEEMLEVMLGEGCAD